MESARGESLRVLPQDSCPLQLIACEYARLGCQVRVPRREISVHKRDARADHIELKVCAENHKHTGIHHKLNASQIETIRKQFIYVKCTCMNHVE